MKLSHQWACWAFFLLIYQGVQAQKFTLPKITYDQVKVTRSDANGNIGQKKYYQKGKVMLEVNYPFKGSIKGYCYSSNIVYDSTYIYPLEQRVYITFRGKKVYYSTWKKGGNLIEERAYWANGKLRSKYTRLAPLDLLNPAAECSGDKLYVGESFEYDKNGQLTSSKNFDTGKSQDSEKQKVLSDPRFKKMRKAADQTLQKAFGKRFFRKYLAVNYDDTKFLLSSIERSRYRRKAPRRGRGTKWFYYPKRKRPFDCIEFAYLIKLDKNNWFKTIVVRVDTLGKVVFKKLSAYRGYENATQGLPEKPSIKFLSMAQALKRVHSQKTAFPLTEDYWVKLIWKASEAGSAKGSYHYQFLYDRLKRSSYGSSQAYYRKALVNASNGKVTFSEDETSEEMEMESPPSRRRKNEKYGIVDYRKVLIPYVYEELPRYINDCMIARKDGKWGVINHKNKTLIPFEFERISYVKSSKKRYQKLFLVVAKNGLLGLHNRTGKKLFDPKFSSITVDDVRETIILENAKGKKEEYKMGQR
ncbi:MAG TPA: hypothetical protein DCS93_32535 [Microscillaceae bacterium]|nr:hypothetical protein [Microscillaceae bacterium]